MDPDADLASVAALMADRHRAQMLLTLLGGTPQSGSALAEAAGISRALASAHLKKLVAGGLVRAQPSGRQQLYSIASEPVADALEILILLAPRTRVGSLGDATRAKSLRWARMCSTTWPAWSASRSPRRCYGAACSARATAAT